MKNIRDDEETVAMGERVNEIKTYKQVKKVILTSKRYF